MWHKAENELDILVIASLILTYLIPQWSKTYYIPHNDTIILKLFHITTTKTNSLLNGCLT